MGSENLIRSLIDEGYLRTPRIIYAFKHIDRKDFVPTELADAAYVNEPLPIGRGQTISQPLTVAFMLELLEPKPGERILEIGAGSGWQTALLAYMVSSVKDQGSGGKVVAIERIPELKEMAKRNVKKYNFIEKGVVRIVEGDGSNPEFVKSISEAKSFDKIIAAAAIQAAEIRRSGDARRWAAADQVPQIWKDVLAIGGRIVTPIGHSIFTFDKKSDDRFKTKEYFGFSFVPLVSDSGG